MSDDTTTTEVAPDTGGPATGGPDAEGSVSTDVAATPAATVAKRPRTTGGQTLFDRFITPVILPLGAVLAIIFVVLNLSRVLLAGTGGGHGGEEAAAGAEAGGHAVMPVVFATVVTFAILIGAATLAKAKKMRLQSLAVVATLSMTVVLFAGWLAVGDAGEKTVEGGAAVACESPTSTLEIVGLTSLKFDKATYEVAAGCLELTFGGAVGHTLVFEGTAVFPKFADLGAATYEIAAGDYVVYCDVPGHRAAGMEATLTVTGEAPAA